MMVISGRSLQRNICTTVCANVNRNRVKQACLDAKIALKIEIGHNPVFIATLKSVGALAEDFLDGRLFRVFQYISLKCTV